MQASARKTRQGVRDLNGPKLDGRHNGRSYCTHFKVTTVVELRTVERSAASGKMYAVVERKRIDRCDHCGAEVDYVRTEERQPPQQEATA